MNRTRQRNFSEIWTILGLFLSGLVGAGFATGREIFVYFAAFGWPGAIGLCLACSLLGWAGARIIRIAIGTRATRISRVTAFLAPKRMAAFLSAGVMLFAYCGYVTMLAGFRDVVAPSNRLLSQVLAVGIFTAGTLLILYRGFSRFATLCRVVTPILLTLLAVVTVWILVTMPAQVQPFVEQPTVSTFILHIFAYTGYNVLFLMGVLGRSGDLRTGKMAVRWGSGFSAGLFFISGLGIFAALLRLGPDAAQSAMPLLAVARSWGAVPGGIFSILLGLAMTVCGASCLSAVAGSLRRRWGAVLAVAAIPLSYIGFGEIIGQIYPVFGLVGIFLLAILAQTRKKNV